MAASKVEITIKPIGWALQVRPGRAGQPWYWDGFYASEEEAQRAAAQESRSVQFFSQMLNGAHELRPVPVYSHHDVTALLLCLQRAAADAGHEISIK